MENSNDQENKKGCGCGCFTWVCVIILAFIAFSVVVSNDVAIDTAKLSREIIPSTATAESTKPTFKTIATIAPEETTTESMEEETTDATTEPETTVSAPVIPEKQYIANRNTKKYHEIWCTYAPSSSSKNYWLTDATEETLDRIGYEPCKKCIGTVNAATEETASAATENTLAKAPDKYNDTFVCLADKTTKIYHNPWCEYAPEFGTSNCYSGPMTAQQLEDEGYKPCAKCIW